MIFPYHIFVVVVVCLSKKDVRYIPWEYNGDGGTASIKRAKGSHILSSARRFSQQQQRRIGAFSRHTLAQQI